MDLSIKDTINIRVVNNTSLPQSVNLLGSTSDPLGVPPSLLYQWDLSSETFFGSVSASIVISNTSNPTPTTYTVQVDGYNIEAVVFALNTLNLGFFQYSGDVVYVSNDFYIYGALTISSTSFVSSWNTSNTSGGSSASNQIQLPLVSSGSYNFIVDWGDGNQDTITTWNQAETLHTYATSGTYTVSLTGIINGFVFGGSGDILKILSISNFGNIIFGDSLLGIFSGCTNLSLTSVLDTPDLSSMTKLNKMFEFCTFSSINNLQNWDVSNIVEFELMFSNCASFNQDISSWNLASANSLVGMFNRCSTFNSPLNNWNVSNVTNMSSMFSGANAFNKSLNSWNVSNVTDMNTMFFNSNFNGNIVSWDVSNVTDMNNMFSSTSAFNQNIGSWNVSSVINMSGMFADAIAFNQSLNSWNVSNVTDMFGIFSRATNFNGNISSWVVSNVTNMSFMFRGATAFNQNIGSWNISNVTAFTNFMLGKTNLNYSSANLDAIYNGWSLLSVQPNININFGTIKYTLAGQAGKNILDFAPNNWTITDGGI